MLMKTFLWHRITAHGVTRATWQKTYTTRRHD